MSHTLYGSWCLLVHKFMGYKTMWYIKTIKAQCVWNKMDVIHVQENPDIYISDISLWKKDRQRKYEGGILSNTFIVAGFLY